jgi:sporulation protein YlmC with PRC-barrel domain
MSAVVGEIKDVEINGKSFSISKGGVSKAMELQGIFMRLIVNSGVSHSTNTEDKNFAAMLQIGMNEDSIKSVKKIIIELTSAPKLTSDTFESLDMGTVMTLFLEHYHYTVSGGEEKKKLEKKPKA